MNPVEYQEVQRFSSLGWVGLVIVPIAVFLGYATYQQLIAGRAIGSQPAPNLLVFLLWLAFGVALPLVFFLGSLHTEVRSDGLYLRIVPLPCCTQRIHYAEIAACETRQYRPLRDFGGWGVRWGRSGKAYTVSGRQGVQLVFKDGRRLLIGSQQPEPLRAAIARHIPPAASQ